MVTTAPAPQPPAVRRPVGWDTEVFVLRGDDRTHLRDRLLTLAGFVERHPAVTLADLASSLAADLAPSGVRVGVVASDAADLVKKVRRAADRLADPNCTQIRDSAGVYFAGTPLYTQGTLALLFPGEGWG